jgi:hypothetical protein
MISWIFNFYKLPKDNFRCYILIYYFSFILTTFLWVYNSCTWDIVMTFPYMHTMYPDLVHPLHYSLSSQFCLFKMTLTGFNVPYSYISRKYINHIHPLLLGTGVWTQSFILANGAVPLETYHRFFFLRIFIISTLFSVSVY